ncbi:endonuclease [Carboxylicivirga marina]|uniref:Endonuclease n=1 Tax=Carboxylicivirga marina TaxID=2800988 RepID=A0ABS1HKB8_9BACT|nr:endonuclease [Carboxylicivirga marina]MBK3518110.1 endonuclease [Carboxylicivirga marina]
MRTFLRVSVVLCLVLLLSGLNSLAQEPPTTLNGEALKQWLKSNWYSGKHSELGYSLARQKMYQSIDNDNNTITCVYSGYEKSWQSTNTSTNPDPVNCEHTVPQSFFGEAEPMRSDIHHLFPTYGSWNSERSNNPFSEINDDHTTRWMYGSNSQSSKPSSNIDYYSESTGSRFEPREDHKGNCARAIFYFYTMYASTVGDISSVGNLNTLYQWHLSDPVDAAEISRNDDIETFQGNRNPYVDYPELVERAFINYTSGPLVPTVSIQSSETEITISWTNVDNETGYKVYRSTDNINFFELGTLGVDVLQFEDHSVVGSANYYYYVIAFNGDGNSAESNVVSAALLWSGGGADDLFFSEYIEGAASDKVLEISNFTGSEVDLSNYSIKKQINGGGLWTDELVLSGSIDNGDVYVVCNSGSSTAIKSIADLLTDSWALGFNGNDPIGLFKNGTYIDAIGTFNNSSFWGEDVTLVRKSYVNSPSTTFNENDWESNSKGTISNLGMHTMDAPTDIDDELSTPLKIKVYPIPAKDNLTVEVLGNEIFRQVTISLIDVTGKVVYSKLIKVGGSVIRNEMIASGFNQGMYFLRLEVDGKLAIRKVIIQ